MAILKIKGTVLDSIQFKIPFTYPSTTSAVGTQVFTLGYPMALTSMGKEVKFTDGKISAKTGYQGDIGSYQTSVPVQPGNSGGPLLDEQANIIGVIRGKNKIAEGTGFAVKASQIIYSINEYAKNNNVEDLQIAVNKKSSIKNLKRTEQIKKANPYVFNVLVYANSK